MIRWFRENEHVTLWLAWVALAIAVALPTLASLDALGLFYDEAWLAQQGRAFVEPTREGLMPPGATKTWLLGRPFPLFALPYLGSLKSQLLIPTFALFGPTLEVLRATTLGWALLALLGSMLLAHRTLGLGAALGTGVLIATDPSFVFLAAHEWGPFNTGLLCRGFGLALLVAGHARRARGRWLLGAFVLGLGVYNRADFVLILGSAGLGWLAFHPEQVADLLRRRRAALAGALACFALGALPILIAAARVLRTMGELTTRGDIDERVRTLWSVLDGSHFHRLMEVGGRFDAMYDASAPFGLFGFALIAAVALTALDFARGGRAAVADGRGALTVTCAVLVVAMLALPGATRAHHMLNLMPFAQMLVAASAVTLARRVGEGAARPTRGLRQLAVAVGLLAVIGFNGATILRTRALIARTGGRGWWSEAILPFARELEAEPGAIAVSLDWGFHLPLLFLTLEPKVLEPIWKIPRARGGHWSHTGGPQHVYLVHDTPYDRFGFGPPFLDAVRALGGDDAIRVHADREGAPAFYSIRFDRPHRITFAGGFRIDFGQAR